MNAAGANWMLVIAWMLFTGSIYSSIPWVAQQPAIPRFLLTTFASSVIGILLYYGLWTSMSIAQRSTTDVPSLTLEITGVAIMPEPPNPALQITVNARNIGLASTLELWQLTIEWHGSRFNTEHLPGHPAISNAPDIGYIDEQTSSVPFKGTVIGLIFFRAPIAMAEWNKAVQEQDPTVWFVLMTTDSSGHQWTIRKSLAELASKLTSTSQGTRPVRR